jgi:hypothetical protein
MGGSLFNYYQEEENGVIFGYVLEIIVDCYIQVKKSTHFILFCSVTSKTVRPREVDTKYDFRHFTVSIGNTFRFNKYLASHG